MRSTNPCVIASMSMFFPSSASIEALMVVFAALAVPMLRLVFICPSSFTAFIVSPNWHVKLRCQSYIFRFSAWVFIHSSQYFDTLLEFLSIFFTIHKCGGVCV